MKTSASSICALVVDDEAPARKGLVNLLNEDRDVSRILVADNGAAAVEMIQAKHPDIVFLDVQMPGINGFDVIDALGAANMPLTVFVTAYDRFAVRAFEADATDYLLKPFGDDRFERTMERVKARLCKHRSSSVGDANAFGPELIELAAKRARPGEIWEWLVVKSHGATRLVMADDIEWISAAGVYVTLHVGGEELLYRASLATVASRLDPFRFVRIHRSTIVNLKSITLLERRSHGEFEVVLKDGMYLMLSRSYRAEVEAVLGQPL
ncbi:LytTR family DNA-binding domain-containing protein [Sphingobium sp. BYY-5]|uniref:LytR/AlgR family response regulator transcription factor n=1 Tax=Sphingobium sp. BYY-5 TaxID=2926400 RepID=UPI001FA71A6F|nr:LytTR family DNA-binding domain-containing protein [Sphingobium sp. BYY-5]MCI4592307.1 LytTR family DNA-binding domain-containing protein [Sphingobium sp. BYY-5]